MTLLLRFPLRYLLLGTLGGFAVLIGLGAYFTTMPLMLRQVEQQAVAEMRADLTHIQGILQMLWRTGNIPGIKSAIASLGSSPDHELTLLTDANGIVLAATSLAMVGAHWSTLAPALDPSLVQHFLTTGGVAVYRADAVQGLSGYAEICHIVAEGRLRPAPCGFLYTRFSLYEPKRTALLALHRLAIGNSLGLAVIAFVVWLICHTTVTRRVEHLIAIAQRFTAGQTTVRAHLSGCDELARLGQAFDTMAQTIATTQAHLEATNAQLSQRLLERQQAEAALQRSRDELEQRVQERTAELAAANEEVRRFAYIVSHDLRAPLLNIKGFAAELRQACATIYRVLPTVYGHLVAPQQAQMQTALQQDIPEALGFIDASVTRMDGLLRAVLGLSRAGRRPLYIESVAVEPLVHTILQTLAHQIAQHQVQVVVGTLPEVHADRLALEQIFSNLLNNAITYLEAGRAGDIGVTAEQQAEVTVFQVRDNGRGIAAADIPKAFELFRRVGNPHAPGEGVGLTYVRTLVRRHGGEVWCTSTSGVGTTFSFTLARHLPLGELT